MSSSSCLLLLFRWGCELRNCRHCRRPNGGPAEWCPTAIKMRPRSSWELRTAQLSPLSWAPG
eukprot:2973086-Pyramimonas_sp.AAC.1